MVKYVTVTQKDIEEGIQLNVTECPFALAARRVFKGYLVTVGGVLSVSREEGPYETWKLSDKANKFIHWFDSVGSGIPSKFRITKV